MTEPLSTPITKNELLKELKRLEDWWNNDAAYRPPEDHLQAYALGNANAYGTARAIAGRLVDDGSKS